MTDNDNKKDMMWALFSFEGVMSRRLFFAYYTPILFLLVLLVIAIGGIIPILIFFWPAIAIRCKRMHDAGRSGWWQIPYNMLDGVTLVGGTLIMGLLPQKKENNRFLEDDSDI